MPTKNACVLCLRSVYKNPGLSLFGFPKDPKRLKIWLMKCGFTFNGRPLMEHLDGEKYTIYMCDPPGYGLSRPPNRDFSHDFCTDSADSAIALMEALGIDRCSMLGLMQRRVPECTAMMAASKAADRMDKLVVWSCNAYVTAKDSRRRHSTSTAVENDSAKLSESC